MPNPTSLLDQEAKVLHGAVALCWPAHLMILVLLTARTTENARNRESVPISIDVSNSGRASKPHADHPSLDQPRTFTAIRRSTLQLQIELECGIWCRARAMAEPPREMEPGGISRKIQLGMKSKNGVMICILRCTVLSNVLSAGCAGASAVASSFG